VDAGEADVATGGPDPTRGIYPSVFLVTAEGVDEVPMEDVRTAFEAILGRRVE
jgi:proteasome beta subunit